MRQVAWYNIHSADDARLLAMEIGGHWRLMVSVGLLGIAVFQGPYPALPLPK